MAINETYVGVQEEPLAEQTWGGVAKDLIRRQPLGALGGLVVILMIAAALFAPQIATHDPEINDFGAMLEAPSLAHIFGTDEFGRDIYSRIVHGARTAMLVGFTAAIASAAIGTVLGLVAGYFGGRVDAGIMRFADGVISLPLLPLLISGPV